MTTEESGKIPLSPREGRKLAPSIVRVNGFALFEDEKHLRSDCRLVHRAIQERWHLSPEVRELIADSALKLCDHPNARVRLWACRIVVAIVDR